MYQFNHKKLKLINTYPIIAIKHIKFIFMNLNYIIILINS